MGFIRELDYVAIDEVQRVPELLLAIKKSVDEDFRPGRFLLTGSANLMTLPRVSDSLAGRVEIIEMYPLAQSEILKTSGGFLAHLFKGKFSAPSPALGDDLVEMVLAGGFPEVLQRDNELPKFVRLMAQHSAQLVNYSQIGNHINVDHKTCRRYVGLLNQLFLVSTLMPWYSNAINRIIKTPKLHFLDSGILAASRNLTPAKAKRERNQFGAVLESFVFSEILKLRSVSESNLTPYHFRDQEMHEVDFVLEREDGMIAGIEVKASAVVASKDFAGLNILSSVLKEKFTFGAVLYDGDTVIPFGRKLAAVPISCLWS